MLPAPAVTTRTPAGAPSARLPRARRSCRPLQCVQENWPRSAAPADELGHGADTAALSGAREMPDRAGRRVAVAEPQSITGRPDARGTGLVVQRGGAGSVRRAADAQRPAPTTALSQPWALGISPLRRSSKHVDWAVFAEMSSRAPRHRSAPVRMSRRRVFARYRPSHPFDGCDNTYALAMYRFTDMPGE